MKESQDKQTNRYSQRIAEKLKNIYGARMQSSNKTHQDVTAEQQEATEAVQNDQVDNIQVLQERIAALEAERNEFRDHAMRKVAELENFRRRTQQEKEELTVYANHNLLKQILPIIDDLQRALEDGRRSHDYEGLLKGIEMVYHKAMQTLGDVGIVPMEVVGKEFDVNLHEALMRIASEAPEGYIVQEAQRGYLYKEKVLRHAKVLTSAGQDEQA